MALPEDKTSAQIMVGFAIIAEHAALDLGEAGIAAPHLKGIASHYREFAAQIDPSTATARPTPLRAV